jgi:HEAT repeat protein
MTRVWETLEHGERVECLDCIPSVEPLLFDNNPRTREIAAWWLRRRAFGVFGPGQVYQRLLDRLGKDADPRFRAYAADAVGEFLSQAGEAPLALALQSDADMSVRAAAARALGRMNSDGKGALSVALGTADAQVRSAALQAAGLVNGFSDVAAVVRTLDDGDAAVRLRAVKLLDQMKATDSVAALVRLVQSDPAANVRGAAAHALGTIGDKSARTALETVAQSDADSLVRDQARFSLRGL